MSAPKEIDMAGGLVSSSRGLPLHYIPTEALQCLADTFELGVQRKGEKAWNAVSGNQSVLTDREFLLERISHVIKHALNIRDALLTNDPAGAYRDAGAVMWGGALFACATKA